MSDRKKTNKKKISKLIKRQVPEFVLSEHPKFAEFLPVTACVDSLRAIALEGQSLSQQSFQVSLLLKKLYYL